MSIKTNAEQIRDEVLTGANTAARVGGNLVEIADDLIGKQTEIDLNTNKVSFDSTSSTRLANTSGTNTGDQDISGKQNTLVSATNIKTINGNTLLGSGDLVISGGGGGITGSGTINKIPKFTASGAVGDSQIFDNGTNVGIGTNSPLSILQVKGKTGVTSFKGTSRTDITIEGSANLNEFNGIDFLSFGQTAPLGRIALKATSDGSQMSFGSTNSFSGGVTKEMTFDEFGRLKVNAGNLSMQGYNLLTGDGTETSFAYIGLKASRADIYFGQVSTGVSIMGVAGGQAFFANGSEPFTLGTLNDKSLILGTNSIARINISGSTGNVSLNASDNGVDKLNVNGSFLATTIKTSGFTVATLPTPPAQGLGARAHVTDALSPTYLGTLTGGGTVKCPVFYNGTAWVSA